MNNIQWKRETREVSYDETIDVAVIKLDPAFIRKLIADHVRSKYTLDDTYHIDVMWTSYSCDVTITKVVEDEQPS